MKTNTRSIDGLLDEPAVEHDPDEHTYAPDYPWDSLDDPYEFRAGAPTVRTRLAAVVDEFARTPAGRRVLHGWFQHELLTEALELLAVEFGGDPLGPSPRALASAFETNLFGCLSGNPDELVRLPEMLAFFVPYAYALRGVSTSATAAALAIIEHGRAGFGDLLDGRRAGGWDPLGPRGLGGRWEPVPRPSPLEQLADEVGGREQLDSVTTDPLPD